jgi:hypothetical protein
MLARREDPRKQNCHCGASTAAPTTTHAYVADSNKDEQQPRMRNGDRPRMPKGIPGGARSSHTGGRGRNTQEQRGRFLYFSFPPPLKGRVGGAIFEDVDRSSHLRGR